MNSVLKAAMCSVPITPIEDEYLEGYEEKCDLSFCRCPQDHVSDLMARMLLIENEQGRMLFLNIELLFANDVQTEREDIFRPDTMERIAAACKVDKDNIMLSNIHTHHAPLRLTETQRQNVIDAAAGLETLLAPAKVFVGTGHTKYGVSRSNDYGIDKLRAYDDLLTVLRFENAETGKPIGLVYSVPIHNTMFGHGPDLKKNRHLLCCEFTGYASRSIEDRYKAENPGFVAMHHNGFYGNSGPIYEDKFYAPSLDKLKEAGAAFGTEILEVSASAAEDEALLHGAVASLTANETLPAKHYDGYVSRFGNYESMPLRIHTGAVGELAYVGINYEAFATLGAHIRAESPYKLLLTAGTAYGWKGYIPTRETFIRHETELEVECQDVKTPLTIEADGLFCKAVGEALCRMKHVDAKRYDAKASGLLNGEIGAVYGFEFEQPVQLDKLVLFFGQELRTSCASDFTLQAFDEAGELLGETKEDNFSSGWYGFFVSGRVSSVKLTARKRYPDTAEGITELDPVIYGLKFEPAQS